MGKLQFPPMASAEGGLSPLSSRSSKRPSEGNGFPSKEHPFLEGGVLNKKRQAFAWRFQNSPHWLTEKVFSVTFQLEPKPTPIPKPRPTYRNPICRAKEYARMIETGQAKNESDLARKIGVSRVRVCQYVRLLSLDGSVIKALEQLGDPLSKRIITERLLRKYIHLNIKTQRAFIQQLISKSSIKE